MDNRNIGGRSGGGAYIYFVYIRNRPDVPLSCSAEVLSYPLVNERYQNNGIARHFDYDSVITGTSMTGEFQNERGSEAFQL